MFYVGLIFFTIDGFLFESRITVASKSKKQLEIAATLSLSIYLGTKVPYLYLAMKLLKCFGNTLKISNF